MTDLWCQCLVSYVFGFCVGMTLMGSINYWRQKRFLDFIYRKYSKKGWK